MRTLVTLIAGAALASTLVAPSQTIAQGTELGGRTRSPACALLTAEDVNRATGRQDYDDGTTGDDPGQGLGGGTSCQWDGKGLGGSAPMVSVVLVPPGKDGKRYVDLRMGSKPRPGCKLERVSGVGEEAFFEECPKALSLPLFVKTRGPNDLVVDMRVVAPGTADSAKPAVLALAKAAVAKMR